MLKVMKLTISIVFILLLSIPVCAATQSVDRTQKSTVTKISNTVYDTGAGIVDRTEGLVTGCLKTTFSFFNPCLDLVKGCSDRVMSPLDRAFDYTENMIARKTTAKKELVVPQPRKPELPKK